jgi:chaperonin GroES
MAARFIPAGDRYLVSVVDQARMLEGVLLPDSTKEDMQAGIIMAVGRTAQEFKKGARVLFGPWAGKEIQMEGVPFRVMREEEIDGKVVYE